MGVRIEHRCNQCGGLIASSINHDDPAQSNPIHHQVISKDVYLEGGSKLYLKIEVRAYQSWEEVCQPCALKAVAKFIQKAIPTKPINVIFDGPPAPESGRFIEVETDDGVSINAGEWAEKGDGLWALRIIELPKEELDD